MNPIIIEQNSANNCLQPQIGGMTSGNIFLPMENIMPDRFNSISESLSFPVSTIGMPHIVVVEGITLGEHEGEDEERN